MIRRLVSRGTSSPIPRTLRLAQRISPQQRGWQQRHTSSASATSQSAVSDQLIDSLAAQPHHVLTLADLVQHGHPPLSQTALFASANFTLSLLPARLAQRIRELRSLPFIVATNPHIARIHGNYMHSLAQLLPWAERRIASAADEQAFTVAMAELVDTHANTIPTLARGFLEARRYVAPTAVSAFLDRHLRARIGTRLIAEQHISLHYSSQQELHADGEAESGQLPDVEGTSPDMRSFIGVIDTQLCPANIVRHCESVVGDICEFQYGERPQVVLDGEPDFCFSQIPVHLEYIVTELLKNAFRASIENRMSHVPVEVTIAPARYPQAQSDLKSAASGVTIRIRDRGGGISPENYAQIWTYSFTTFDDEQIKSALSTGSDGSDIMDGLNVISGAGGSSLAGLGYGLPLSRAYAEYFGGSLAVQSLWGWGTDVYLTLKGVPVDK